MRRWTSASVPATRARARRVRTRTALDLPVKSTPPSPRAVTEQIVPRVARLQSPVVSPVLDLFSSSAAIPSPPGEERASPTGCSRELRDLGLDSHRGRRRRADRREHGEHRRAACADGAGHLDLPLRAPRHGSADRRDRAGRRGRRRAQRPRHDPRRRRQVRGRDDARRDAADPERGHSARRDRARLHAQGGDRARGRLPARPRHDRLAGRLLLRPRRAARRDRRRGAVLHLGRRGLPRPRRARRDEPGGRALRDRRSCTRDRRPAPGPARRRDDRERRD